MRVTFTEIKTYSSGDAHVSPMIAVNTKHVYRLYINLN